MFRHETRRTAAIGFFVFTVIGIISYAAYTHQWSELSALRHIGSSTAVK
jgi:hypothetical protein